MSGAFTRTLDMLGWGSRQGDAGGLAKSREAAMLERQVLYSVHGPFESP